MILELFCIFLQGGREEYEGRLICMLVSLNIIILDFFTNISYLLITSFLCHLKNLVLILMLSSVFSGVASFFGKKAILLLLQRKRLIKRYYYKLLWACSVII